jgi:hypothetical protein
MTQRALQTPPDPKRPVPSPQQGWFTWWVSPGVSLLWRIPLFLLLAAFFALYIFRGLVHMAFLFDANQLITFIFAPILLPLAALPAGCFYFVARRLPRIWRNPAFASVGRRTLEAVASLPVALLAAVFIDLIEVIAVLRLGIRLPRLPLDLF